MNRRAGRVACALGVVLGLSECVRIPPKTSVARGNPSFIYNVPDSLEKHKVDITIAIVRPAIRAMDTAQGRYGTLAGYPTDIEVTQQTEELKRIFVAAVKKELDRIVFEKGMRTMGPFDTFDELTFSEKKEATYALVPEVELRVAWPPPVSHRQYYKVNGELTIDGEFMLILSEPLSGQKIWSKRLAIPRRTGTFTVSTQLNTNGLEIWDETHDDRVEVAERLVEPLYQELMETIWRQADPNEFVSLRGQSDELKHRSAPTMR